MAAHFGYSIAAIVLLHMHHHSVHQNLYHEIDGHYSQNRGSSFCSIPTGAVSRALFVHLQKLL